MVIRNILEERIALMFIIHTAAIMLHSVADNQVIYFQYHIISGNLIENSLRYFNVWCFIFYNHPG